MSFKSALFVAGMAMLATAASNQFTVNLPYKDVSVETINGETVFKGAPVSAVPGQPLLPSYKVTILLPPNANPQEVKVSVDDPEEELLSESYDVKPAAIPVSPGKTAWPSGMKIQNGRDFNVYSRNEYFPAAYIEKVLFGKMREHQIVEVTINPYLYNPVSHKLKKLTSGTLKIQCPDWATGTGQQKKKGMRNESNAEKFLKKHAINPEVMDLYQVESDTGTTQRLSSPLSTEVTPGTGYAIITTNAIVNGSTQMQNLINQKTAQGYTVFLITENVWGGGYGNAAAENIRSWLRSHYITNNIHFLLLIGNPDPSTGDVPMKMCWPDLAESEGEIPTDFFYAELSAETWDINGDGISGSIGYDFGQPNGPDIFAEVAVGRIPVYDQEWPVLDKIITKIIRYENETAVEWRRNVLLPVEPMFFGNSDYLIGERIKSNLLEPDSINYFRLYDGFNAISKEILDSVLALNPPSENPTCNEKSVLDAWRNNDFGLVVWWSHGWSQGAVEVFTSPNAVHLDDIHPAMTFQGSCNNAWPEDKNNLAYSLLVNGCIATVAATRVESANSIYSFGEPQDSSPLNLGMQYAYAYYLIKEKMGAGVALNTIRSNIVLNEKSDHWDNLLVFNLYGSPDEALGLKHSVIAAPSGLSASATACNLVELSWTDNSTNENGFLIERASLTGTFTELAIVGTNVCSYQDFSPSEFTAYRYRVSAFNDEDTSLVSKSVTVLTHGNIADNRATTVSSSLSGFPGKNGNDNSLNTNWSASSNALPQWWCVDLGSPQQISGSQVRWELAAEAYRYRIETSNDNQNWTTRVDLTNSTSSSQVQSHDWIAAARYVRIYITALPHDAWACFSEFSVFGNKPPVEPPSLLTVTDPTSTGIADLSWEASPGATSYNIWVSKSSGGPYALLASEITQTSYTFPGNISPKSSLYFAITAVSPQGESVYSTEAGVYNAAPIAPGSIIPVPMFCSRTFLTWADNSEDEDGFNVYWSTTDIKPSEPGATLGPNSTSYTLNYLSENTKYHIWIEAYNSCGVTHISTIFTTDPCGIRPPVPPGELRSTAVSDDQINLSWTDYSSDESGFIIQQATSSSGPWEQIGSVGANVTEFSSTGLSANTTYHYRIYAFNNVGNSLTTDVVSETTLDYDYELTVAPSIFSSNGMIRYTMLNPEYIAKSMKFTLYRIYKSGAPRTEIHSFTHTATTGENTMDKTVWDYLPQGYYTLEMSFDGTLLDSYSFEKLINENDFQMTVSPSPVIDRAVIKFIVSDVNIVGKTAFLSCRQNGTEQFTNTLIMVDGENTFTVPFNHYNPLAAGQYRMILYVTSFAVDSSDFTKEDKNTAISVSPSAVSFGQVAIGSQKSETITITNTGNSDAVISGMIISESVFSHNAALPLTVTPGSSVPITLTFMPGDTGFVLDTLSIINAPDELVQTVKFALSGEGIEEENFQVTMIADANVIGNSIQPQLTVKNIGSQTINLSDIVIEYYSYDSSVDISSLIYDIYYCSEGALTAAASRISMVGSSAYKADVVTSLSFSNGSLGANQTVSIHFGMHTADWQYNFDESDDWSGVIEAPNIAPNIVIRSKSTGNVLYGVIPGRL